MACVPESYPSAALLAAARDAVLVIDDSRRFVDANPAASRLLGVAHDDLIGRRIDEFLDGSRFDIDAAWRVFLAQGQQAGQLSVVRADGERCPVEYNATAEFTRGRHLVILRDISERKRAETEQAELRRLEQQRLRETETLYAVSRALSSTLDQTETLRRVARAIAHTMQADTVGAYLADEAGDHLVPVAGYHVPPALLDAFRTHPLTIRRHPAIRESWASRRAIWSADRPGDAHVNRETLLKFPHQTDLFVPISVKDQPIGGFFVIWWAERRVITDGELRLLEGISELAGIFLENGQLHRDAASANRAKDEFLATLSHELRNPLGAIVNALAALERRGAPDEVTNRLRQIIHRQADHLGRLVDDLLDVARTTAGKIVLNRQPLDLSELVGGCVRVLRTSGRARQHRITLRAESVVVNADATRLAQIAANMLDNAVKFTPSGGSVDIDVQREGDEALLRVSDNGIGIAPEMLSRVFELFAQGDQPMGRPAGGLGIGLTLSRRLVELHGGTITVESDGRGHGAQFTVRLPVETGAAPAPRPAEPTSERRRNILIVEDNDDARESLKLLLESLGHQVIEAGDGQRGLTLAVRYQPEVVLIDLGLPGLDGYELARVLRSTPEGKNAALIAVTGYGQQGDRRRSREMGFDAHLVKPVSQRLLSSLISAVAGD
jgi:PAS domain S-box-containing protein